MDTKKFALGTLAGGVAFFLLGWLLYGMLFMKFFEANAGTATGVNKVEMDWLFLILGNLSMGALFSYIFVRWAGINTPMGGLKAGAMIGLLFAAGVDLMMYGTTNISNITATFADIAIWVVMGALAGAAIGWVVGMGDKK
ncbi:MAG: hypothetical protein HUU34_07305 [Saprospiraceae bacterium]|jgi:hypothetical protein|nr:hypothetical protein [Saprospiraceae bacterium]